jgi:hypothetical protein
VGAAIARGNQGEKGKIALLVMKVIPIKKTTKIEENVLQNEKKLLEKYLKRMIDPKKKQSPIRFIIKVNMPEVIEDWF